MKSKIRDKEHLYHILECIELIEEFTRDIDYEAYMKDIKLRLALTRLVEIIGEAAASIDRGFKKEFDEVEWKLLKGIRNVIVHEYFGIDYKIIWEAIQDKIPGLKIKIQHVLDTKFPEQK